MLDSSNLKVRRGDVYAVTFMLMVAYALLSYCGPGRYVPVRAPDVRFDTATGEYESRTRLPSRRWSKWERLPLTDGAP